MSTSSRNVLLAVVVVAGCMMGVLAFAGSGPTIPGILPIDDDLDEKLKQLEEISRFDLSGRDKANQNFHILRSVILDLAREVDELKTSLPREIFFKECRVFVTSATNDMNYHRGDGQMAGEKCPLEGWVVVGVGDAKHKGELRMQNLYCCELGF